MTGHATLTPGTTPNPGEIKLIDGVEYWIEPDGYTVEMKFVRKYPALYGPLAVNPDGDQGDIECEDLPAHILAKLTGYGGTYSTWAERHCSIVALTIAPDIHSSADVPPCPKFWLSENQYWVSHIAIGRLVEKEKAASSSNEELAAQLATSIPWKKVAGIATAALAAGAVVVPPLLQQALKLVGGS